LGTSWTGVSRHRGHRSVALWVPRSPTRLVVPARVQDELAHQLAVLVQDPNVQAVDEQHHALALEGPSDADVVERAAVPKSDLAVAVHAVVSDPGLLAQRDGCTDRPRPVPGVERGFRRDPSPGPVRTDLVVVANE